MSNTDKRLVNTGPYAQLANVAMTESEREEAIYALQLGEAIASAILWIVNGVKRRFVGAATKPGFKREVAA